MSERAPSVRRLALQAITRVLHDGQSLAAAREPLYSRLEQGRDRAFAMRLVQGVLRWRWKLEALLAQCLDKPLRNKEHEVQHLLLMALYELLELDTPDYAAVDEAVKLARGLRRPWARGLVNAVLRRFSAQRQSMLQALSDEQRLSHPQWLQQQIARSWPQQWRQILEHNNAIAATHLRVNRMQCSVEQMQQALLEAGVASRQHSIAGDALVIDSTDITLLPGYEQGWFSVQDAGAQCLPGLLCVAPGQRVLDLCAAPGGKACHLLESCADDIELLAVDIDSERLRRVEQNLERLRLHARLLQADAATEDWYQGEPFDRIVVDAPCSASGVIRRHPDIKSLRRQQDIAELVQLQHAILAGAWRLLKPGGSLLYVTCSVLAQENSDQVAGLLAQHEDARERDLEVDWGIRCEHGRQLLPGADDTDGFYYALIDRAG